MQAFSYFRGDEVMVEVGPHQVVNKATLGGKARPKQPKASPETAPLSRQFIYPGAGQPIKTVNDAV